MFVRRLYYVLSACCIGALVSCSNLGPAEGRDSGSVYEFGAGIDNCAAGSRTHIQDFTHVHWDAGDEISVCERISEADQTGAIFRTEESGASVTFRGEVAAQSKYYAVSPASALKNWKQDGSSAAYLNLKRHQTAVPGTIDPEALLMCAKTSSQQIGFTFGVLVSMIKFTVAEDTPDIVSMSLTAPGKYLVGSTSVTVSYTTPELKGYGTKISTVDLAREDGQTLPPGNYYIAVLPGTYPSLEFSFKSSGGKIFTETLGDVTLSAGTVYTAGTIPDNFSKVRTYKYSDELAASEKYQVSVDGEEQFVYPTTVLDGYDEQLHICQFGCKDEVAVKVAMKGADAASAVVRPVSLDFSDTFENGELSFRMKPGDRAIVEFDGDSMHPLFVFANQVETPDRDATWYFEAGKVYTPAQITLKTGESVYIEGGAVVKTTLRSDGADNISICGAGILDASDISAYAIHLRRFNNLTVKGITAIGRDSAISWFASGEGLTMDNYKALALFSRKNPNGNENDAIDFVSCTHVRSGRGFSYSHDDCCIVKADATVGGVRYDGPSSDIVVDDHICAYRDTGHGCGIGYSCFDDISDVTFRNIYVPYEFEVRSADSRKGQLAVHNVGDGVVSDILFENIYLEQASKGQGIFLGIFKYKDSYYGSDGYVPGQIRGITFRNVHFDAFPKYGNYILGYGEDNKIQGVTFDGLYYGNTKIMNRTDAGFVDGNLGGYGRTRFGYADEPIFN